jgi:transcriptional regulator with GAF, ATPase, and Fis domain
VFSRRALSDDDARRRIAARPQCWRSRWPARSPPDRATAHARRLERRPSGVLAHTGGRISGPQGAAAILGLKPTTLDSRIKKLGVRKPPRGGAAGRSPA